MKNDYKYKLGEKIFCEFQQSIAGRVDDNGCVLEAEYGYGTLSGNNLNHLCRPRNEHTEDMSDQFVALRAQIDRVAQCMNINWLDISVRLTQFWTEACDDAEAENNRALIEARSWVGHLCSELRDLRKRRVGNVLVFRQ